jgi:mannitol-1-/sugar-/sorbitol-6-/2-deoxyglucose-6-phosphatase
LTKEKIVMIEAVIFDMDGLLIDSEPLWQEAEINVFGKIGVQLTREECMQTMGYKISEVVPYWFKRKPWKDKNFEELESEIFEEAVRLIIEKGEPMKGVNYVLDFFRERKIRIGLASTSPIRIIKTVLSKLNISHYFEELHSAEFEEYGKPHPAVFITAAKKLGLEAHSCLVFEDSFNGLIAAKAARMKTVVIPDKHYHHLSKFDIADYKLNSLLEFSDEQLLQLNKF